MTKIQPEWRKYQSDVSTFLQQLGFHVQVEERVPGARGEHDIDVTARITVASIPQLWLVECKKWRRPVPKERILTFVNIVSDIGADRGLVFSESGFQAGAVRVASNTNVTLTSLADFSENAADELLSLRVKVLDERAAGLNQKFLAIWDLDRTEQGRIISRYESIGLRSIFEGEPDISTVTARLSQIRSSLEDARFGRWPVPYVSLDNDGTEFMDVTHWDGLIYVAEETIATCERIYDYVTGAGGLITDLAELQTPELTELLKAIRQGRYVNRSVGLVSPQWCADDSAVHD